ncbi:MAG: hypothetical protein PHT59_07900, partial [Candidatus Omnitrophica bacterium]|nr:hypothetical protein [Candidatus Omnitrophota bacterium]
MSAPMKHGAISFWRRGVVPKGKEYILEIGDQVIREYVEDFGGPEEISTGQAILFHNLKRMLIVEMLASEDLARTGIVDKKGNISPVLGTFYIAILNGIARHVDKLGLKRTRGTETWTRYLASR